MKKHFNIKNLTIIAITFLCTFAFNNKVKAGVLEDYYNCVKDSEWYDTAKCNVEGVAEIIWYNAEKSGETTVEILAAIGNCVKEGKTFTECSRDIGLVEAENVAEVIDDVKEDIENVKNDVNNDIFGGEYSIEIKDNDTTYASDDLEAKCKKIEKIKPYISTIYTLLRYAAPALIIIFSTIEFTGVVLSGEDEKMEKAKKHFITRLIVGIVVLILPFILEFIFRLAGLLPGEYKLSDLVCYIVK